MNKDTKVELEFSTNRFWELSMSDLGYTEGMTEEEFQTLANLHATHLQQHFPHLKQ